EPVALGVKKNRPRGTNGQMRLLLSGGGIPQANAITTGRAQEPAVVAEIDSEGTGDLSPAALVADPAVMQPPAHAPAGHFPNAQSRGVRVDETQPPAVRAEAEKITRRRHALCAADRVPQAGGAGRASRSQQVARRAKG